MKCKWFQQNQKDIKNILELMVTFWDNMQYGSVVKCLKPKAQYDYLPLGI